MLGGIISKPWSYQIVLIFPITLYSLFFSGVKTPYSHWFRHSKLWEVLLWGYRKRNIWILLEWLCWLVSPPYLSTNQYTFLKLSWLTSLYSLLLRYIEASKSRLYGSGGNSDSLVSQAVLLYVFENILKLLHPFMPFVTEDLWQVLITCSWPFMLSLTYFTNACLSCLSL